MKNWKDNYEIVTAFALGEATPEQSAQLEEQMKNDPELRSEVEEIRRMGDFLTEALANEPIPENKEYSNVKVLPIPEKPVKKHWSRMTRTVVCVCSLLLIVTAGVLFWPNAYYSTVAKIEPGEPAMYYEYQKVPNREIQVDKEEFLLAEKTRLKSPGIVGSTIEAVKDGVDKVKGVFSKKENTDLIDLEAPASSATPAPALPAEAPKAEIREETRAVEATTVPEASVAIVDGEDDDLVYAEEWAEPEEKPGFWNATKEAAKNGFSKLVEVPRKVLQKNAVAPGAAMPADTADLWAPRMKGKPAPESYIPPVPLPRPVPVPEPERFITPPQNRNSFSMMEEQKFQKPEENPFSTFGVDVDTASYTLMRQFLTEQGRKPPKESVRVEEYINYFKYDLKGPAEDSDCPFETTVEIQKHPWREGLYMAMVALKGREIPEDKRPKLNLVFLLDVSGSMSDWNKLPLVKDGMMKLLDQLKPEDHVSIVTYANGTDIKLEPTPGTEKGKIEKAILELRAYGGTNGGEGIQRAYELARKNFDKEAENRVILCTDGDFNVGMTDISELENLIESEAKSGVFLTVLGFGMGNFQDDRMKSLASHGNGVYGYIDSRAEAKKMLCDGLSGSMITIAKDVKLQIDFNPAKVAAYRLIGYETRHLEAKDFHDDRKDSGDLGAGHSVVALYELVPAGAEIPQVEQVDESRYAPKPEEPEPKKEEAKPVNDSPEWFFVKLRWKQPNENESTLKTFPVEFKEQPVSQNFQWASGTALFAMLLRESAYTGTANFDKVLEMIHPAVGESDQRKEFEELVKKAKE